MNLKNKIFLAFGPIKFIMIIAIVIIDGFCGKNLIFDVSYALFFITYMEGYHTCLSFRRRNELFNTKSSWKPLKKWELNAIGIDLVLSILCFIINKSLLIIMIPLLAIECLRGAVVFTYFFCKSNR